MGRTCTMEEKAIFAVLRKHGPLTSEEVLNRVSRRYLFDAVTRLPKLINEGRIIELEGCCYIPNAATARKILRSSASA